MHCLFSRSASPPPSPSLGQQQHTSQRLEGGLDRIAVTEVFGWAGQKGTICNRAKSCSSLFAILPQGHHAPVLARPPLSLAPSDGVLGQRGAAGVRGPASRPLAPPPLPDGRRGGVGGGRGGACEVRLPCPAEDRNGGGRASAPAKCSAAARDNLAEPGARRRGRGRTGAALVGISWHPWPPLNRLASRWRHKDPRAPPGSVLGRSTRRCWAGGEAPHLVDVDPEPRGLAPAGVLPAGVVPAGAGPSGEGACTACTACPDGPAGRGARRARPPGPRRPRPGPGAGAAAGAAGAAGPWRADPAHGARGRWPGPGPRRAAMFNANPVVTAVTDARGPS